MVSNLSQPPPPAEVDVEPEPGPKFKVGDRVEDQQHDAGTVAEIAKINRGGGVIETTYRIKYDHGGEGWQSEDALNPVPEPKAEEPEPEEAPEPEE